MGQLGQTWYFVGAYELKVDDLSRARGLRVRSAGQEWVGHGSGAGQLGQTWYLVGAYVLKVDDLSRGQIGRAHV